MANRRHDPGPAHIKLASRVLDAGPSRGEGVGPLPSTRAVRALVDDFLEALFPGGGRLQTPIDRSRRALERQLAETIQALESGLQEALYLALHRRCGKPEKRDGCRRRAASITARILASLPQIRTVLAKDVLAAYDADPAASGVDEIVACYPGLFAIAIYRVAHRLLREGAQIVPRMLTEHAHSRTGIDIHPGAAIGESFFIDHGTGIVIGETTTIGRRVRIYQGVTLGALSVKHRSKYGDSRKRHPTIEDDVVIYANATILGGDTVIGRGAVVGGNAWITYSVPPGIRVGVGT